MPLEKDALTARQLHAAASKSHPEPTPGQRLAGNYRMGHVRVHGLDVTVEVAKGRFRRGVSRDGKPWARLMKCHYGYIRGTESRADGDHVDVFLGDAPGSELVFVVNQTNGDGSFDEHKCVLGVSSRDEAERLYLSNYPKGWSNYSSVVPLTVPQFKRWLREGHTGKPLTDDHVPNKAASDRAAVLDVIRSVPEADLYGAWYNAGLGKARVSLGDWSETSCRSVEDGLTPLLGEGNVEVDCEIGAPEGEGWEKVAEDAAVGLPDRSDLGDWSKLSPGQVHDLVVQRHEARRAGTHNDVRFGSPDTGLFSWATRKELPAPGERVGLFRQPVHRHEYGSFEGEIPEGYGAGTVRKALAGKVLLTKVTPDSVHFARADTRHPERYALVRGRDDKSWVLVNTTPSRPLPYTKAHHKPVPRHKAESFLGSLPPGSAVQPKVDGASALVKLLKDRVELASYRTSSVTGRPILYTEKFWGGRGPEGLKIPPELVGAVLKGELYGVEQSAAGDRPVRALQKDGGSDPGARGVPQEGGVAAPGGAAGDVRGREAEGVGEAGRGGPGDVRDGGLAVRGGVDGRVLHPSELGALLNSGIARSLGQQRARNVALRVMLYDVESARGLDPSSPYADRRRFLEGLLAHLPADRFHLAEQAETPEDALDLWRRVESGKHPLTREGVVVHPPSGRPSKIKTFDESDVHVTGTFPGEGRRASTVGGLTYAHEPGGPTAGRIGTGFSDDLLADIAADPDAYVGRVARIRSQERLPSGAYRAPSFLAFHEDYPSAPPAEKAASDEGPLWPDDGVDCLDGEESTFLEKACGALDDLIAAKGHSDRREYDRKHAILRGLVERSPGDFKVDSRAGSIVGLTHVPTGFRVHVPARVLPDGFGKEAALLPGVPLQPHQAAVAGTGKDDEARVLAYHTVGAGKTLAAIAAAENAGAPYTAVTPASLRENYRKEREKWTDGSLPVNLASYNALAKGEVAPADTVVFDEAQNLRNPDSARTLHAKELAEQARHVYLLSGTPVVNQPHDLAPMIEILTGRHMTPEEFDDQFVDERKVSPGFFGWLRGIKPADEKVMKNEAAFEDLLRGHVSYYAPAKPNVDRRDERYEVELGPEQTDLYQAFWDQLPFVLRWKLQSNFPLTRKEMIRLQSFSSGPRQVSLSTLPFMKGNADPLKAYEQSPKLKKAVGLLADALSQNPESKGVVYSNFVDAGLAPYGAALDSLHIPYGVFHGGLTDAARKKVVEDYNAGRTRALLLGPSGGEGLSLKGTRLLQILDPHWNSARTTQAVGRGIRFDSHDALPIEDRNVTVQRFMSRLPKTFWQRLWRFFGAGTPDPKNSPPGVDHYLEELNARKDRLNNQFLDALKRVGSEPLGRQHGWFF